MNEYNKYTPDLAIPCAVTGCKNPAQHQLEGVNVCEYHEYTASGYPNCAHPGCKAIGDNCLVAGSPDRYCGTHYDEIRKHNAEQERIVLETLVGPRISNFTALAKALTAERESLGLDCIDFQVHENHVTVFIHIGDNCRCCSASIEELSDDRDPLYGRVLAEMKAIRSLA